jgi:hypothetical protein
MPATTFVDDFKHLVRNSKETVQRHVQSATSRMRALPPATRTKIGICVATAALFIGGLALRGATPASGHRAPPVIRSEARATLADVRPPSHVAQRNYAVAKVEESQGSYKSAAENYATAARQGNARALNKLVAMTRAPKCDARSEAADALGTLRNKKARVALKKLAHSRFKDESRTPGIFSCSSRRAAEKALEKQRG